MAADMFLKSNKKGIHVFFITCMYGLLWKQQMFNINITIIFFFSINITINICYTHMKFKFENTIHIIKVIYILK